MSKKRTIGGPYLPATKEYRFQGALGSGYGFNLGPEMKEVERCYFVHLISHETV